MNPNKLKFRRSRKAIQKVQAIDKGFSDLSWGQLTKMAREAGVFKVGMTREKVEAALLH